MLTVQDLIDQVRSTTDTLSPIALDDQTDILPALNRAKDYACNILARHYEDPLVTYVDIPLVNINQDVTLPEDCFEDRIEAVYLQYAGAYREIQRVGYRDMSLYDTTYTVGVPLYYAVIGRKFRLVPKPSAIQSATLRVWYLKSPDEYVLPQGRITSLNLAQNYLLVDSIGSLLTTESDNLNSYFNVINGATGEVRGSFQIQLIEDNRVQIKTSPNRTNVLGRAIQNTLTGYSIEQDDYICQVKGTCVPQFARPLSNFVIQFTTAEMQRKLNAPNAPAEEEVVKKFEDQVERSWVGREEQLRVKKSSKQWQRFRGRPLLYYNGSGTS
jgi:hypothetical protein